ncbi:hypothetical protein SAMN05216223_107137 [Actinacidiphila yanglinensis]|uniref:Uncharacterized protein n=1 Tax=Actinacidiphila yanglinensis TaxID=310779 RepID=A0A1H6BR27_9ACTN|nr:hypothetical protein [Actinacidiphila yanglinensis]SEG63149.1 hypothetical protein SAMN05216223_107137 [Actinacidiphila yanglinensis]
MSPPRDAARRPEVTERRRRYTEEELRPRPPHPAADFMIGVVVLIIDGAMCLGCAFVFAMRDWGGAGRATASRAVRAGAGPVRPTAAPVAAHDWTPTITFGVITALAVLSAIGCARAKRPITAAFQAVAAVVLLVITCSAGHGG